MSRIAGLQQLLQDTCKYHKITNIAKSKITQWS